jgi:hypothetical protein
VRFDETELPGLLPTIGYLDFHHYGSEEIGAAFLRKVDSVAHHAANSLTCACSPLALILGARRDAITFPSVARAEWTAKEVSLLLEPDEPSHKPSVPALFAPHSKLYAAYQFNVVTGKVVECAHLKDSGKERWALRLQVEATEFASMLELGFAGVISDQMALIRARHFLLNEQPGTATRNKREAVGMSYMRLIGVDMGIRGSLFPYLFHQWGDNPSKFLSIAWIVAVFHLKFSGIVADIRRLELSLLGDSLEVEFVGLRKKTNDHAPACEIQVRGNLSLRNVQTD